MKFTIWQLERNMRAVHVTPSKTESSEATAYRERHGMPDAVRRAILSVVLAFCGNYCYAQSMRVPYHQQVTPARLAVPAASAPAAPSDVSISKLSPSSASSTGSFVLTVDGLGFSAGCTVNWNGTPIVTNFVSSTPPQLKANVTAALVAATGTKESVPVTVTCGGPPTAALPFGVLPSGLTAGTPTLTSISPTSAAHDDQHVVLTANGTGFGDSCMVNWNGAAVATYINSATQLTATISSAQMRAAEAGANVPVNVEVTVKCSNTGTETASQVFRISPPDCAFFPTRKYCLIWGGGSDPKTEEINNLNDFFNTNVQLSFLNQVKSIYNAAAGSTNLSVDLAKLNFLPGMQWTVTTNAQVGSSSPTAVGSGTVPTLSSTSAAQAAQNMLWGGTVLTSMIYPILAVGGASLTSPGGAGVMLDVIGKGGVDIQNFKSSANINVNAPPTHASAGLEGYFFTNSVNAAPAGSSSIFAGSLFGGFSYGYSYTSHGYARDYGFGNAVHNAMGQISVGILMNNVATISISRGFGPKQSYIDSTSMAHVYVDNFKTWSLGVTYQPAASANSK